MSTLKDKRIIEPSGHADGSWFGKRNGKTVCKFWYESDAREWVGNDPLNRGTLDELAERFPEDFGLKD